MNKLSHIDVHKVAIYALALMGITSYLLAVTTGGPGSTNVIKNPDTEVNYLKTDDNEFLAHDVIEHTLTATDVANNFFTEPFDKAPFEKIVAFNSVLYGSTKVRSAFDDNGPTALVHEISLTGTTLTVTQLISAGMKIPWAAGRTVKVYIVYEK